MAQHDHLKGPEARNVGKGGFLVLLDRGDRPRGAMRVHTIDKHSIECLTKDARLVLVEPDEYVLHVGRPKKWPKDD